MSKEEIKVEINKVLDHLSDNALSDLLNFLKELDSKNVSTSSSFTAALNKILLEDNELLHKLAQ